MECVMKTATTAVCNKLEWQYFARKFVVWIDASLEPLVKVMFHAGVQNSKCLSLLLIFHYSITKPPEKCIFIRWTNVTFHLHSLQMCRCCVGFVLSPSLWLALLRRQRIFHGDGPWTTWPTAYNQHDVMGHVRHQHLPRKTQRFWSLSEFCLKKGWYDTRSLWRRSWSRP